MQIDKIPEIYFENKKVEKDLFIYDFRMTTDVVKNMVNLGMNMFSFLQVGTKQVHFADTSVAVNRKQSLLLKKGNWLWTELLDTDAIYCCKLFFFSERKLQDFLKKHTLNALPTQKGAYFLIENDEYILSFVNSISTINNLPQSTTSDLLSVKFEEILLYLLSKYGVPFEQYLHSLVSNNPSSFKDIVESNIYSNLNVKEVAFLCNMSISTFKRHFQSLYHITPGKWFQEKRLDKAKEILSEGKYKPSDIYLEFGYNNLSNFSAAFKKKFGVSPKDA